VPACPLDPGSTWTSCARAHSRSYLHSSVIDFVVYLLPLLYLMLLWHASGTPADDAPQRSLRPLPPCAPHSRATLIPLSWEHSRSRVRTCTRSPQRPAQHLWDLARCRLRPPRWGSSRLRRVCSSARRACARSRAPPVRPVLRSRRPSSTRSYACAHLPHQFTESACSLPAPPARHRQAPE
jgi:hypothetical protein